MAVEYTSANQVPDYGTYTPSQWETSGFHGFMNGLSNIFLGNWFKDRETSHALALQQDAQAFNSAEAEKNRAWQQQMAETQYQRTVNDIKAAGLNPWLALQGGLSNTSYGSSAASSSPASSNGGDDLTKFLSSAVKVMASIIAKI